jgi:hypothetical protein
MCTISYVKSAGGGSCHPRATIPRLISGCADAHYPQLATCSYCQHGGPGWSRSSLAARGTNIDTIPWSAVDSILLFIYLFIYLFIFLRRKSLQDRSCRDNPRLAKRDMPGQDTGRPQGHLSRFLSTELLSCMRQCLCQDDIVQLYALLLSV